MATTTTKLTAERLASQHAADDMAQDDPRPNVSPTALLQASAVLLRVALIIVVWLAVFLLTFLGYLTLPALALVGLALFWGTMAVLRRVRGAVRPR
ncbi:MAG: hypothetical protein HYX52_04815 [Chloroflexi bacterium]|nr:hypothetical protein [Chloroflexota bacterium]